MCGILSLIIQRKTEKIKITESQLSEKKYIAYANLVSMFYNILKDVKNKNETNGKATMERMIEAKKDLFIYGSDEVFKNSIIGFARQLSIKITINTWGIFWS